MAQALMRKRGTTGEREAQAGYTALTENLGGVGVAGRVQQGGPVAHPPLP